MRLHLGREVPFRLPTTMRLGWPELSDATEITSRKEFEELLTANSNVVVDFWAPWCEPCLTMEPIFEKFIREHGGESSFARVNVDQHPDVSRDVTVIPTFQVYSKGRLLGQVAGRKTALEFETAILRLIRMGNVGAGRGGRKEAHHSA
jgi:thioredoxin 1